MKCRCLVTSNSLIRRSYFKKDPTSVLKLSARSVQFII